MAWVVLIAWVHKILAWVKKPSVGGVGPNFGVYGVDLMCFVKDVLLNILQNLSEKHLHWGLLLNKVAG